MDVEQLLAEREIYRNLVKLSCAMDERDWASIEQITIEDIESDVGLGVQRGRGLLIATLRQFLDVCGKTQHMLGNVLIDVDGNTATSQAYVADLHVGKGAKRDLTFRTLGVYNDDWVKVDDAWLLSRRIKRNRETIGSMDVFAVD